MYVCICRAVTDKVVKATIRAGAATVDAVADACGAGGDCGGCRGTIDAMIEDDGEAVACGARGGRDATPCHGRLLVSLSPGRAA
jgi:bacterioferritin-associated ferredoxin